MKHIRLITNNVFGSNERTGFHAEKLRCYIEDRLNNQPDTTNYLEEKIMSAVHSGDNLVAIHTKLISILQRRLVGLNLIIAIMVATTHHIRCSKELAGRRWLSRKQEHESIKNVLINTCLSLRQDFKNNQLIFDMTKLQTEPRYFAGFCLCCKMCLILAIGRITINIQQSFLCKLSDLSTQA